MAKVTACFGSPGATAHPKFVHDLGDDCTKWVQDIPPFLDNDEEALPEEWLAIEPVCCDISPICYGVPFEWSCLCYPETTITSSFRITHNIQEPISNIQWTVYSSLGAELKSGQGTPQITVISKATHTVPFTVDVIVETTKGTWTDSFDARHCRYLKPTGLIPIDACFMVHNSQAMLHNGEIMYHWCDYGKEEKA